VNGVLPNEARQFIFVSPGAAFYTLCKECGVVCISQSRNALTFCADKVPTKNIVVYVTIQCVDPDMAINDSAETEEWTFTFEDGTTVTKDVYVDD